MTQNIPKGAAPAVLPPFSAWLASNIPAVYDNTMSYYDELTSLINYLETVILPALNEDSEAVTALSNLYKELKSFVEHYFDNLDVQEEINNKLDAMVEAGTLQEIISEYLNSTAVFGFNTVADMTSAENLIDGSFAKTLGFYAKNDGGGATYKIREITNDDVVDGSTIIEMGDGSNDLIAELIVESPINVKTLGAYGDGIHDDYAKIQLGIDSFHHNTIYFPAGDYLITQPIEIGTTNAEQVDLKLEGDARIFSNTSIDSLLEIGKYEGSWSRYQLGSIVTIDGGIFDATNTSRAIYLSSNRKQTNLKNITINNASVYGIYIVKGTNTSGSSDANLENIVINCDGSENTSVGLYVDAHDNKISNVRINRCMVGVNDRASNYYQNVHCLTSWTQDTMTKTNYERTIGYKFEGSGVSKLNQCYADTFGVSFEFNTSRKIFITNSQAFHYLSSLQYETVLFKDKETIAMLRLYVSDFDWTPPSITGDGRNIGLDLRSRNTDFRQYLTTFESYHFSNININEIGRVEADDYINCRSLYTDCESFTNRNAWVQVMEANKYYPIGILRGTGVYDLKIANGTDQIIKAKFRNNSTPSITVENIYSGSHANQFSISICDTAEENGVRKSYLCLKSTANNNSFNPCVEGFKGWNNQYFSKHNYGSTPLTDPTVNAEVSFNP